AGLHALAAADAGALAHGIVEVEHDRRVLAAKGVADDVVGLYLATGPLAAGALDAGIEVHRHGGVTEVGVGHVAGGKARLADAEFPAPVVELGIVGIARVREVGGKEFEDHLLRLDGTRALAVDHHAVAGLSAARRCEHALALDLDHAGAAVAVGTQPVLVAQVRNVDADA